VISLLSLSVLLIPNKNTSPERQIPKDRPERHESVVQVSKKNIGSAAAGALSSGKDSVMDVLVMENVLYAANTTRIYDLKGSERSRWSQEDPTQAGAVLMDDNLRENNLTQPILVCHASSDGPLQMPCPVHCDCIRIFYRCTCRPVMAR